MNAPVSLPLPATSNDAFPGLSLAELELAVESADRNDVEQSHTLDAASASDQELRSEDLADAAETRNADMMAFEAAAAQPITATNTVSDDKENVSPAARISAPELETVELELTLRHEDLVKLTFEDSLRVALDRLGGSLLFEMRLDNTQDCQRVAAVRLGEGDDEQFALVIMPPAGGAIRVEPTDDSANPLAGIAESYAGVMDALKIAA